MARNIELLEAALARTAEVVRNVRPEQYGDPTPCQDWDVRTLLNHLVIGNYYFGARARHIQPDQSIWDKDKLHGGSPAEAYDESAKLALDAYRAFLAESPDGSAPLYDAYLTEVAVHGWDLATATGQDRTSEPRVAEHLLATMPAMLEGRRGSSFGQPVTHDEHAPPLDRLAAFLGRTP